MDRERRDLYVEGTTDQAFLEWLVDSRISPRARVVPVDYVDIPEPDDGGGNRGRLLNFLTMVASEEADIRGLVDADFDRLFGVAGDAPPNAWLTDHRDLESYVLAVENFDAAIRGGCGLVGPSAADMFASMADAALFLASVRVVSLRQSLKLPISKGTWIRHVKCADGKVVEVKRQPLATGLLQAAGHSLKVREKFLTDVERTAEELAAHAPRDVLHGKDCMLILTKQLSSTTVEVDDAGRLVRGTFQRNRLHEFATLAAVVEYLAGA